MFGNQKNLKKHFRTQWGKSIQMWFMLHKLQSVWNFEVHVPWPNLRTHSGENILVYQVLEA